ncbi:MAG TPA: hypothetical protein VJ600_05620 [Holophagaceae bacterium]|nr:hypothetical protein [Holophagaceae bacterium]
MRQRSLILPATLSAALLVAGLACSRESEAAKQAELAAKSENDRVAQLEKELADMKAGKAAGEGDAETTKQLSDNRIKSVERQLKDAKRRAEAKKREAAQLASQKDAKVETVTVPAGTKFPVKLSRELATDKDQSGATWEGTLTEAVTVNGATVWPAGTAVSGVVTQSVPAGRLSSGKGVLAIKVTEIGSNGVDTDTHAVTGDPRGERNAKYIGGGAALGALVGLLSDKKHQGDHALGGAAIGAAAGTGVAAATADTVIRIKADTPLSFTLATAEPVTLKK